MPTFSLRMLPLPHCEDLLAAEVSALTGADHSPSPRGIEATVDLETAYRLILENRSASRCIIPVAEFTISDGESLYNSIADVPWEDHLSPSGSFRIDSSIRSRLFSHTNYPVLRAKDAIVDRFRSRFNRRPDVASDDPDLILHLRVLGDHTEIGIDLGGGSLHRRGHRTKNVAAPLRENLAAAILLRAEWPVVAAAGGSFVDPFCGSGTFCIEAAMMAADYAPGLRRSAEPAGRWSGGDAALWRRLLEEYEERAAAGIRALKRSGIRICGSDIDPAAIAAARANASAAGLEGCIQFRTAPVSAAVPPEGASAGLVVANPPYGERLESESRAEVIYTDFGLSMRRSFAGWRLAFLTPEKELGLATGIRADKTHSLTNGALQIQLVHARIEPFREQEGTRMFINRLKKNRRQLKAYLARRGEIPYRLYDKDMPEYAFAVDIYGPGLCHLQEYAAPSSIDPRAVRRRRREALEGLFLYLEAGSEGLFLKERRRLGAHDRYGRQGGGSERRICREGELRFFVNFTDYLDTGLFLDSRELRRCIRERAAGKSFLNLFAYTCTATVAAAAGGASESLSVDTSRTYLDWGRDNLRLNGFESRRHELVQSDVGAFLNRAAREHRRFDLAYVDPPTYSNSKQRSRDFEVQRDHVALIRATAKLMNAGGTILFCTNYTRFEPDPALIQEFGAVEITEETLPLDFARRGGIHRAFRIDLP